MVIRPQFQKAWRFYEGRARVFVWKTMMLTEYFWNKPQTRLVNSETASPGLFFIGDERSPCPEDWSRIKGTYGFIDRSGRIVIDAQFPEASDFHEGLAQVGVGEQGPNTKTGYIDHDGKFVIPPIYSNQMRGRERFQHDFSDGLALARLPDRNVYLDRTGKVVLASPHKYPTPFHEGVSSFQEGDHKMGLINKRGQILLPAELDWVGQSREGLVAVCQYPDCWFYDPAAKRVMPNFVANRLNWGFSGGLAIVAESGVQSYWLSIQRWWRPELWRTRRHVYIDKSANIVGVYSSREPY